MLSTLVWVILLLLAAFFLLTWRPNFSPYVVPRPSKPCIGCHGGYDEPDMCSRLAAETCQVAEPQLQDCWLNHYSQCVADGSGAACNCSDFASSKCQADNAVAQGCYAQFRAKCLAAQGLGPDPDR